VTNQETVRANALRILVDHFAQPTHWDIVSAYDVSHWVAQYAVRLIDSSYEPNVPDTTPKLPLQLALGNSWALGGTGPLVNPNGYAARLQQTLQAQRGPIRLVDIGKASGTTTTANLVSRRLPYALDLLQRSQLQAPAIRDAVLHHGAHGIRHFLRDPPPLRRRAARRRPNNARRSSGRSLPNTRTRRRARQRLGPSFAPTSTPS
jgi:hypothetical protein